MKKNWLIALPVLLFIIAYQYFVVNPYNDKLKKAAIANSPTTSFAVSSNATATENLSTQPLAKTIVQNEKITPAQAPRSLEFGSGNRATISSDGRLGNVVLKDFFVRERKEKINVELLTSGLKWQSSDPTVEKCLRSMRFVSEASAVNAEQKMSAQIAEGSCSVTYRGHPTQAGLLSSRVSLEGFAGRGGTLQLAAQDSLGSEITENQNYISYKMDDSVSKVRGSKLNEATVKEAATGFDWLVWGDRYFSTLFLREGAYKPKVFYGAGSDPAVKEVRFGLQYALNPEQGKSHFDYDLSFYFGPRDPRIMSAISPALVETVDLGFFSKVAQLMLWALRSLNVIFHNYGLSIIALTVLVRLLFWPLNKKAYKSGILMKQIQPEVERIKKKYPDRSQMEQMNRELMNVYKTKKVNPLGSCLPMLLQIPIFIGLYGALNHSIDLYQAPFMFWIHDLSSKDPFYVFPILWTLSLLLYMRINPQAMNPQPGMPDMKWMFMGMNLFFGFLSRNWPAGLTLYLFVSNSLGITQQYFILKSSKKLQPVQEGA